MVFVFGGGGEVELVEVVVEVFELGYFVVLVVYDLVGDISGFIDGVFGFEVYLIW